MFNKNYFKKTLLAALIFCNSCKKNNYQNIESDIIKTNKIESGNGSQPIKNKTNKYEWSKSLIEKHLYYSILNAWSIVNATKGSLGSWTGNSAFAGRETKNAIKNALNEIQTFENGEYKLRKNINWIKVKKNIDHAFSNVKVINGPLTFATGNWNSAKARIPQIKITLDKFVKFHFNKNVILNKNELYERLSLPSPSSDKNITAWKEKKARSKLYNKFIEQRIINSVLNQLGIVKEYMPYILWGATSRENKNIIKDNIEFTKSYLKNRKFIKARNSLKIAKSKVKSIINANNISTKVVYNVTWDRIEEKLIIAYTTIDEYLKFFLLSRIK